MAIYDFLNNYPYVKALRLNTDDYQSIRLINQTNGDFADVIYYDESKNTAEVVRFLESHMTTGYYTPNVTAYEDKIIVKDGTRHTHTYYGKHGVFLGALERRTYSHSSGTSETSYDIYVFTNYKAMMDLLMREVKSFGESL